MERLNALDWICLVLAIIGGINWGLVGLFQLDLVATLFGGPISPLSRIVYIIIGIASVYLIYTATRLSRRTFVKTT